MNSLHAPETLAPKTSDSLKEAHLFSTKVKTFFEE